MNAFARVTPGDSAVILNDPAWQLYDRIAQIRKTTITPKVDAYRSHKHYLNRLYMNAQMLQDRKRAFYPDANLTLRLAYGNIKGLNPEGPAGYAYQTFLSQAVALDGKDNKNWYKVPDKLKKLYKTRDFGRWGVSRKTTRVGAGTKNQRASDVPLAFVASNHTSGGNSGSPVLNRRGELIGTNFDRAYEGTMSDYLFDPNRCRNITVDIRYTLFIIEKFGEAGWLLDEMVFVK